LFKLRTTITPSGQVLGTTEDLAHDLKIFHELLPVLGDMLQALDIGQAMATDEIGKSSCLDALLEYEALEKQHPESITVHLFGIPDEPVDLPFAALQDRPLVLSKSRPPRIQRNAPPGPFEGTR
jgi:hypothetical protein